MSSDSDFDDDEDELLQDLISGKVDVTTLATQHEKDAPFSGSNASRNTQARPNGAQNGSRPPIPQDSSLPPLQAQLYRADGEISILRAQLSSLQQQKQTELDRLQEIYEQKTKNNEDQVAALRHVVQKLEDEKKFLNNELKTTSYSKRRKTGPTTEADIPRALAYREPGLTQAGINRAPITQGWESQDIDHDDDENNHISIDISSISESQSQPAVSQQIPLTKIPKVIKLQNDSSLLIDHLWNYCINGSPRTSLAYLSKIGIDFDVTIRDLKIIRRTSISSSIIEFLMIKKNLRLDELIESFCLNLFDLIDTLWAKKNILSIPFLVSLIHCSVSYRPLATSKTLIVTLLKRLRSITNKLAFLVDSSLNEEDFINYHDVPNQVMVVEKFIFICCVDLIEKLVTFASIYDEDFIKKIWSENTISQDLFIKCLPENSERFRNSTQINLVSNFVEMLVSSITPTTFAYNNESSLNDSKILSSLLKIFIIDISIKDDFMFFGLNRILGNNSDFKKIDSVIPVSKDLLNNFLILIPQPIPFELLEQDPDEKIEIQSSHEFHVLNLRLKVGQLLEAYIVSKQSVELLKSHEHFKSIIRIIGFEQIYIMRAPKSKFIYLRVQIVSILVKILNYLTKDVRVINDVVYPETMYELHVVLSRIAFGSDSLSIEASKLLLEFRKLGRTEALFNAWCEIRARELHHLNYEKTSGEELAEIESDFANGFEFPYEADTVELAREILNISVNHEDADNLYFNMNPADSREDGDDFDEMELVS